MNVVGIPEAFEDDSTSILRWPQTNGAPLMFAQVTGCYNVQKHGSCRQSEKHTL